MATDSSILAWRIPWTEEPGGLWSMDRVAKSQTRLGNYAYTRGQLHVTSGQNRGHSIKKEGLE